MSIEIEVSCPGCNAVFNVPSELSGEIAECSECATVFEIPKFEEVTQIQGTETGAIKGKVTEESEGATNTVKLSRTSIGMIPSLKDSFTFGDPISQASAQPPAFQQQTTRPSFAQPQSPPSAPSVGASSFSIPKASPSFTAPGIPVESPQFKTQLKSSSPSPAPQSPPPPSAPPPVSTPPPRPPSSVSAGQNMTFKKPSIPAAPSSALSRSTASSPQQAVASHGAPSTPRAQLPSWTKIQLRSDEQLLSYKEIMNNPVGVAIGASSPILLCIVAVYLAKPDALIAYGVILIVWLLSFITIAIVASKQKIFIALTSARVILIAGSKRIEMNK